MKLYDDKTKNVIKSGTQLLIMEIDSSEDVTFKASYIVASDLHCAGKITALFDLIVYGNVNAEEIDVKGRFVCLGSCSVSRTIVVQDQIWCEELRANSITCHNIIVVQSIDADKINADGNILVGKTLAIEEKVQTFQNVICGETAYGAGKIAASRILTVEPLDLDDGEEAIESPFLFAPQMSSCEDPKLAKLSAKYASTNDYISYIKNLSVNTDVSAQARFQKYLAAMKKVESVYPSGLSKLKDVSLLFWMIEISESKYFYGWNRINEWTGVLLNHFRSIVERKAIRLQEPKPALKLEKGNVVSHSNFGKGIVRAINIVVLKGKPSKIAVIDFETSGEKKFPLPGSLKFFTVLSEREEPSSDKQKVTLQCDVSSYSEWVSFMYLIDQHKEFLGKDLYEFVYGVLLAKIGLKSKFVEDRFIEKRRN